MATLALASASVVSVASAAPSAGSATHGGMQVTGAFLPLPASPSVASAYLVFHNLSGRADTLISARTPVASQTMAMSEGSTSMKMLGPLTIPPHGRVVFTPGHDHLMLEGLHRALKVGQSVDVRLQFRHAGTVDLKVPVVPLNRILGNQSGSNGQSGKGGSKAGTTPTTMGPMRGM